VREDVATPGMARRLSPLGVTGSTPEAARRPSPDPALPPRLAAAAGAGAGLAMTDVWLGWEVARSIPAEADPEGATRRGIAWLVAFLSADLAQGATRLPLRPPELIDRAAAVGAGTPDRAALDAVLRELCLAGRGETATPSSLAGTVGSGRPLRLAAGGPGQDGSPTIVHLESARTATLEGRVAEGIRARLRAPDATVATAEVAAVLRELDRSPPRPAGRPPARLSREQQRAVATALTSPLSVITGGPGTGKTSVVVSILRAAARLPGGAGGPPRIALAAPTGRAADRMRRSVASALAEVDAPELADRALLTRPPPARTLHRLLAFDPAAGRAGRHPDHPLDLDLVVVDETSMADLELVAALLGALRPETRLVLLGDADQLPAVESGAVLRDLVAHLEDAPAMVRLTRSFRMDPRDPAGRHVLSVARRIRLGDPALTAAEPPRRSPGDGATLDSDPVVFHDDLAALERTGVVGCLATDPRRRAAILDAWGEAVGGAYARSPDPTRWRFPRGFDAPDAMDRLATAFREREAHQILAPGRRPGALLGVEELNAWFAARRVDGSEARGSAGGGTAPDGAPPLRPGEPVLATRNDYRRGLWNGDPGIVVDWPRRGGGVGSLGPAVVFPAVLRAAGPRDAARHVHPLSQVSASIERAYATTVHKAQGSEHDAILLVLPAPGTGERLATRELVYTALTRARRRALLVGEPAAWTEAVSRRLVRATGLRDHLDADGAAG